MYRVQNCRYSQTAASGTMSPVSEAPTREVHQAEALAWLADNPLQSGDAIVTSMPDVSEIRSMDFAQWRTWFIEAARQICSATPHDSVAIFYQTDIKVDDRWVDKSYLVHRGAEEAEMGLLWHKIAARIEPGRTTFGRPAYSHMLCFSRELRLKPSQSSADVLPHMGEMTWARAIGLEACRALCRFLCKHTQTRRVIDPFCGLGSILAVANEFGLDAVGVDLSAKRVRKARRLGLEQAASAEKV